MRVFRPLTRADRDVLERRSRIKAKLSSMSDVDRIIAAKVELRPMQQVQSSKVTSVRHARLEYNRNRTLESIVNRDDRGAKVPRTILGGKSPRRVPDQPATFPHRSVLQTVREYGGRVGKPRK